MKPPKTTSVLVLFLILTLVSTHICAQMKDTIEITPKCFPFFLSLKGINLQFKTIYSNAMFPNDSFLNRTSPYYGGPSIPSISDSSINDSTIRNIDDRSIYGYARSYRIQDTFLITYYYDDNPSSSESNYYQFSIKFVVDSAKALFPFFLYSFSENDFRMRGAGGSDYSLFMKDLPIVRNPDGSFTTFLTKTEVSSRIDSLKCSYGSYGENSGGPNPSESVSSSLEKILFDTTHLEFQLSLAGLAPKSNVREVFVKKVMLFPNPLSNTLHIELSDSSPNAAELVMYDFIGRKVKSIAMPSLEKNIEIPCADLTPGLYFVRLGSETFKVSIVR